MSAAPPLVHLAPDAAILTIRGGAFEVLLVRRGSTPYEGGLALPGGFLEADETVDEAAARELREETGLSTEGALLEQVGVYSDPGRDPRRRVVSVAYVAMVPDPPEARPGRDAADARWTGVGAVFDEALASARRRTVADAVAPARRPLAWKTVVYGTRG